VTQSRPSEDHVRRLDLAYEAHRRGDSAAAGRLLDPLLVETPDLGRAWMLKGVLTDPADFARQLSLLEQAVAVSPGDAEAWYNVGVCLGHARRWREAAAANRRALSIDPLYPEALANGCELERILGDHARALDLAARRIAQGGAPWGVHLGRALCLIALARPDEAEGALAAARETAPPDVDIPALVRRGAARA